MKKLSTLLISSTLMALSFGTANANAAWDAERHAFESISVKALQGDVSAKTSLGHLYESGIGVTENPVRARMAYQEAAEGGNEIAMAALGRMYLQGKGVSVDHALGMHWMQRAADAGHVGAQYMVGVAYLDGKYIGANEDTALYWLSMAAESGHQVARQLHTDYVSFAE
ncbi:MULTISPECIES: tetratricopeptide repeat protein [unclassified Thioalkalivibrio]|uniref:tetratricopeptide repeat protein n=1 Tax=unclassified Thioalkalivibrio TaxID=2621013 RepID=UPI0003605315|nr:MULTISPECIES: tetratricopeptide repeat protein [unclassified Thioalkalivibrio]